MLHKLYVGLPADGEKCGNRRRRKLEVDPPGDQPGLMEEMLALNGPGAVEIQEYPGRVIEDCFGEPAR
jgi:hypothetical protein